MEYIIDIIIILNALVLYQPAKAIASIFSEDKEVDMSRYDANIYLALIINSPLLFMR